MSGALLCALQLSQHMLAAAQAQAWDTVSALQIEREPLLIGALAPDANTRAQLAQILVCNRDIASCVAEARDLAAVQWHRENTRAQAVAAYSQA